MIFESRLETMRAVAEHRSFVKAARSLGISAPAVTKQIKSLEDRLGIVLFYRTTRKVTLTEAGEQLSDAITRSHEEVSSLITLLSENRQRLFGKLKINAPMAFGERYLTETFAKFAKFHPELLLEVEFDDRRVNIIEDGYDVVIRIGALKDSNFIAKKLSNFDSFVCASPCFIEKFGRPETPNDLRNLPAIIYSNSEISHVIELKDAVGKKVSISSRASLCANSAEMLLDAALHGIGYVRAPSFICMEHIKTGKLIRLLPNYTLTPERGIYAIYPAKRHLPLKVRKFVDYLSNALGIHV